MSYTDTTFLGLKKADKGSNQPFETDVFNANWNAIDAGVSSLDGRLDVVEPKVTTLESGASSAVSRLNAVEANNWVTNARIADNAVNAAELVDGAVLTAKIGDSQVTAGKLAATLDLTGRTVSVAAPTVDAHAATKKYVDDAAPSAVVGAWSVVSSPVTNGLAAGKSTVALRYQTVGKTVRFSCRVDMTASSPVTGPIGVQLPVASPVGVLNLSAMSSNGSGTYYSLLTSKGNITGGSTGFFIWGAGAGTYVTGVATSTTVPFTWQSGSWFEVSGTYEIA
jgi:hypothetical protein